MKKTNGFSLFSKIRTIKIQQKIDEQLLQVWVKQKQTKKSIKNWVWKNLGIHLGRVWDALESLLNDLGRVWASFLAFKTQLVRSIGPRWALKCFLNRF